MSEVITSSKRPVKSAVKAINQELYYLTHLDLSTKSVRADTRQPVSLHITAESLKKRISSLIEYTEAIRDQRDDQYLRLKKSLQKVAQQVENLFINKWGHDRSETGTIIADCLLAILKSMNSKSPCRASVRQYRGIKANQELLAGLISSWNQQHQQITTPTGTLREVCRLKDNSKIFTWQRRASSRGNLITDNLVLFPKPEDHHAFALGAVNTDEYGLSEQLPGAVAYLSRTICLDENQQVARVLIPEIQGMFKSDGPFTISKSKQRSFYNYPDWRYDLLTVFFQSSIPDDSVTIEYIRASTQKGSEKNEAAFKSVAERYGCTVRESDLTLEASKRF